MHQPTERVLDILDKILSEEKPQKPSELSRTLSIPKGTLSPILNTLSKRGYLSQNSSGEYGAGIMLYTVGSQLLGKFPLLDFVGTRLEALVNELLETAYLGILDGGDVLYLKKTDSPHPLRVLISTGKRLPAYSTGIGKALLMDKSEKELSELYPKGLAAVTEKTVKDISLLKHQLEGFAKRGYSEELEESTPHIRCIGVPIRRGGNICAAVSIAIPTCRFDESIEEKAVAALKALASEVEEVMKKTNCKIGDNHA